MSTTDWTVNQLGDEWNVVEWNDHFDPEVRPPAGHRQAAADRRLARPRASRFFPAVPAGKFTLPSICREVPVGWHMCGFGLNCCRG
jgi:hypothetical protein